MLMRKSVAPRFTVDGRVLNAHQGSMLFDPTSSRYFLYGNHHRDCVATTRCHCVGDPPDAWTVTTGIGIYSSADLESWRYEAGPVLAPFNQPRVIGPVLGEYRMYLQFPLRIATSASAAGPFELQPGVVSMDTDTHDMNVMLDGRTGRTFMIYSAGARGGYALRVQELMPDGRRGKSGASSLPFPPRPCEAPVLFQSSRRFYAVFGHNCWCCAEGAEAFAFSAPDPLGPWTAHGDINVGSDGRRIVRGQTAFVQRLGPWRAAAGAAGDDDGEAEPTGGRSHGDGDDHLFLAFDLWMTGSSRASMLQVPPR